MLRIGDLVRHKSGGPVMLVCEYWNPGNPTATTPVYCEWISPHDHKYHCHRFNPQALTYIGRG